MQFSQLHRYSVGLAAENKPLNTRQLNVTPSEILSAIDGEIAFNPEDQTVSGTDRHGNRYEVKTTMDITLTAEWLPLSSNRVTPPDIRRGEPVEIYRMADTDQYYWRPLGLRDDLRRLETVIYAFNGSPTNSGLGVDPSTCYFMEISTHKRLVTFSTSQANGEPYGYTFQLDTGGGTFTFEDTVGNTVHVDSGAVFIEAKNADGTYFQLDRVDIKAYAPNDIDLHAGNNFILNAGNNIELTAKNDYILKAGNSIYMQTPETTIDCPQTSATGNVNVAGNLGIAGGIKAGTGGGGGEVCTIQGEAVFLGGAQVRDSLICDKLVALTSVTAPNL